MRLSIKGSLMGLLWLMSTAGAVAAEPPALAGGVNPGYIEPPAWFKQSFLDLREDLEEASAAGKRLLLYFHQDGCPYCKKLVEQNFGQRRIAEQTRAGFEVIAINMWGDREVTDLAGRVLSEKDFAAQMRVMFTPTLVFLDEQGQSLLRLNGYYPPHKFAIALDYAALRGDRPVFRDYLAQRAPQASAGRLHAEPFFSQPPHQLSRREHPAVRPLAVLFEQRDCPACDELHADVLKRPSTRELLKGFDVVQLDMWSTEKLVAPDGQKTTAAAWARQLGVQYAPSLVFFDEHGAEVFRTEAYLKSFHVQSVLEYVASAAYREEPSLQRFIQRRADRLHEQGIAVDLMD